MKMVTKEEFGSLIAEYEGFRDMILDEIARLREDFENLREDFKDLKTTIQNSEAYSEKAQQHLL